MAMFMMRFKYAPETWARLRPRPEDRLETTVLLSGDEVLEALSMSSVIDYPARAVDLAEGPGRNDSET